MHEKEFLNHGVERLASRRCLSRPTSWCFVVDVTSGIDIEEWAFQTRDLGDHTKMGLARKLQLRDGLDDAGRDRIWQLPRQA
eukprot:1832080-Karenia_brevis.AAC.1